MVLALTLRSLTSTLLPVSTIGTCSQTRTRSPASLIRPITFAKMARWHTMPIRNILVRDTGRDVKHDDTTLAVDVVAISQPAKLFLTCSIPNIELDTAEILYLISRLQI